MIVEDFSKIPEYCTFQKVRQNFPEYLGFVGEILA